MPKAEDDFEVGEIARAWLVKMRGDDARSLRAEFEAWLAAAPAHRAAYDRIARAHGRRPAAQDLAPATGRCTHRRQRGLAALVMERGCHGGPRRWS
ncbi:DUF4880 domain-containing protein [Sphingopyxis sp.]|uniref:DUF4880 domain-containing protein n=1 Tax=Sphingopyxis sp. TaxID=1908224 RepID=UPI0025F066A5|nr:DUF4880 domain-containing protein [Sphingopyxis sp.]MBK6413883.1 DUF4880 domain-containing protein [Sphingopyxis sp.]